MDLNPSVLGALIGACSALGGVVISGVTSYVNESRKMKIAETQRWDERLLELSVDLLNICETVAPRHAFAGNNLEEERRKGVDLRAEMNAMNGVLTRIQLLGPDRLHQRANNLSFAVFAAFAQPLDENRNGRSQQFNDLRNAYNDYVAELKDVLSTRRGRWYQRKPKSLAEQRGPVETAIRRAVSDTSPD